jgi:protein SCO1
MRASQNRGAWKQWGVGVALWAIVTATAAAGAENASQADETDTAETPTARSSPWLEPEQREESYNLDFDVLDHTGQALNLRDLLGRPMAVTMIYTRCPDPNMCPLMAVLIGDLEQRLAEAELAGRARLVVVSFDPTNDTPEVLRDYMTSRGIDFSSAVGIVPPEDDVRELVWEFGTAVQSAPGGLLGHSIDLYLIDAHGRFVRYHTGRVWDNELVLDDLRRLIAENEPATGAQDEQKPPADTDTADDEGE